MADNEKYACGYKNSQTGEIVYYKDKDARSQLKDIAKKTITTEERAKLNSLENYDDTSVKNDIQTQKSRIDTFTTLQEGSTTGDAELIDARAVSYTHLRAHET